MVLNDSHVSSTGIDSSESVKDDVPDMTNYVGHLNEVCQKKGYPFAKYELVRQLGEPHCPIFEFKCTLDIKGYVIEATGKGCPKGKAKQRSAQEAISQLRQYEVEHRATQDISTGSSIKIDIGDYFKTTFHNSKQLAQNIFDRNSDYSQTLDNLAKLLDCELKWSLSSDQVVLQMIVKQYGYTLVTTDAASDKGVTANQGIAAKKSCSNHKNIAHKLTKN